MKKRISALGAFGIAAAMLAFAPAAMAQCQKSCDKAEKAQAITVAAQADKASCASQCPMSAQTVAAAKSECVSTCSSTKAIVTLAALKPAKVGCASQCSGANVTAVASKSDCQTACPMSATVVANKSDCAAQCPMSAQTVAAKSDCSAKCGNTPIVTLAAFSTSKKIGCATQCSGVATQVVAAETKSDCASKCESSCGDKATNTQLISNEKKSDCASKCKSSCGDKATNTQLISNETKSDCASKCESSCGDKATNTQLISNETKSDCASKCKSSCGDKAINTQLISNEKKSDCASKCKSSCGDKATNTQLISNETKSDCASKCESSCGDKATNTQLISNETKSDCASKCESSCGDKATNTQLISNEKKSDCASKCESSCGDKAANVQLIADEKKECCSTNAAVAKAVAAGERQCCGGSQCGDKGAAVITASVMTSNPPALGLMSKDAKAEIGKAAPSFTLVDTNGIPVSLADLTAMNKVVVLEWFNPMCPYVVKHHDNNKTMANTYAEFRKEGVVWLAINSGSKSHPTASADAQIKAQKGWDITYPILMDPTGEVGKAYAAKTTPHMYVIDRDGILRYAGAIDNDRGRNVGDVNYVRDALRAVVSGETVSESTTRAYGCSVKYAK